MDGVEVNSAQTAQTATVSVTRQRHSRHWSDWSKRPAWKFCSLSVFAPLFLCLEKTEKTGSKWSWNGANIKEYEIRQLPSCQPLIGKLSKGFATCGYWACGVDTNQNVMIHLLKLKFDPSGMCLISSTSTPLVPPWQAGIYPRKFAITLLGNATIGI